MQLRDWYQTYREHQAWTTIENTITTASDNEGVDDEQQDMLDRIRLTLAAILPLRNSPTVLVSAQMLQQLQNTVSQNVHAPMAQWVQTNNVSQLTNAHNSLHSVLEVARGWPSSEGNSLRSAAATLREAIKATNQHVSSITALTDEVKDDLNTQLEFVQQQMDKRDGEATDKLGSLETQITGANETLAELDERLDTLIEQQQTRFDTSQQERANSFEESLDRFRESLKSALERGEQRAKETVVHQRAASDALLAEMEEIKRKTQEISSVVATSTTSEAYQIEANSQKHDADLLRAGAIGLLIAAAVVTVWWIWGLDPNQTSDQALMVRVALSVTLVGAAIYCMRESTKHRNMEFENRNLELKLRALDPFIQPVKAEKREEVMLKAAHYFFGLNGDQKPARRERSLIDRLGDDDRP